MFRIEYPEDVERIVKVAFNRNWYINPIEAQTIWQIYSNSMCASWMSLPIFDDELWDDMADQFPVRW